jgi:hypothetical protein
MKVFTISYRKRFWIDVATCNVNAYSFADAEQKFNDSQEEDDLIIIQILLNEMDRYRNATA